MVFLAAILWCGWSYVARWTVAPPGARGTPAAAYNIALFTAFAFHHSLFARLGVRAVVRKLAGPAVERSTYVWIASLLLILVCATWEPVAGMWWHLTGAGAWNGRALQLVGVLLTVAGARAIDVGELAGLRQVEGPIRAGGMPTVFRTTGVYGVVRHPI